MENTNMERIKELISKYSIFENNGKLCTHYLDQIKKDGVLNEIKTKGTEIIAYLQDEEEKKRKAYEERKAKIAAIKGLAEIQKAITEINAWNYKFGKSFEGKYAIGGQGVGKKPDYDIEAMKKQYPIAAAYLTAEAQSEKNNYELAEIGKKALEAIIETPENYESIIEQMNIEISQHTNKHMWD